MFLGSGDSLKFEIKLQDTIKLDDGLDKTDFFVYPVLNDKKLNDDSVCVDLYNLAIIYQRIKNEINHTEIKPYVCVCGDNGCIGVFSSLEQSVGFLNVTWAKPKDVIDEAKENEDLAQYVFLEKNKYTFNKKRLLQEIDNVFKEIQSLKEQGKGKVLYDTFSFYDLDNAIRLWQGQEPVFQSKEEKIKEAIKSGEEVDYTEVLSVKDILSKITTDYEKENKTKDEK